ncbi:MAG: hypothetical protein AMDU2_EPLC00005G0326 [Thermoplasmatales archaeon E-plasma]|nr:MAG: hypothetical protein AMDU2_EPLC00005G0326 [Thermoplasmatales archaeon E-plasma]
MSPVFTREKLKRYHLQRVIPLVIAVILMSVYVVPIFYHSSNTIQNNKIPFQSENMVKLSGNVPYIISNGNVFPKFVQSSKSSGRTYFAIDIISKLYKYKYVGKMCV